MITAAPVPKVPTRLARPTFTRVRPGLLQRQCHCGGAPGTDGACQECREEQLRRKATTLQPANQTNTVAPPIVHEVLRSPGQRLDPATRAFMEPRFGHDFSGIRVHNDVKAAESARAVHALAYTVGQHVVFGAEQYVPETFASRRLLAHELAHTIQQSLSGSAAPTLTGRLKLSSVADNTEQEAESAATQIMRSPDSFSSRRLFSNGLKLPQGQWLQRQDDSTNVSAENESADEANTSTDPCAGWETDPQSFSIQLAQSYYRTEYINPKSQNPSVVTVTGAWDPKVAFYVTFDNGDVVGVSMKWIPTQHVAVACTKQSDTHCTHRCEYTYQCSAGSIFFTKVRCRDQ